MTIVTQASYIVEDQNGTHINGLFDVIVDVLHQVKNNDVTYVQLSRAKEHDASSNHKFLCEIPVYHPFGVEIDESNWASYLYLNLYVQEGGMKKHFKNAYRHNVVSIKSHPTIGRFYFEINTGSESIALIIDRPAKARTKYRNHPNGLVVSHPSEYSTTKNQMIVYNNRGILVTNMNDAVVDDGAYFAHRRERFTPKEEVRFILDGVESSLLGGHYFLNKEEYEHRSLSLDRALIPYQFGNFEYFKSGDGKVILTLQKNPVSIAYKALRWFTEDLVKIGQSERAQRVEIQYSRILVDYILGGILASNDRKTLLKVIELIESDDVMTKIQ
jgi:hypothetical protein